MSGPVVAIGYLLLVPCVIGMLIGLVMMFATGGASDASFTAIEDEYRSSLVEAGIPETLVEKSAKPGGLTATDRDSLSPEQRTALSSAELAKSAGQLGAGAGTAVAGGFGIFLIVVSFVGGLLGWLLIMKKKVLQCGSCKAVVAAS